MLVQQKKILRFTVGVGIFVYYKLSLLSIIARIRLSEIYKREFNQLYWIWSLSLFI